MHDWRWDARLLEIAADELVEFLADPDGSAYIDKDDRAYRLAWIAGHFAGLLSAY